MNRYAEIKNHPELAKSSTEVASLRNEIKRRYGADTEEKSPDRFAERMTQTVDKAIDAGMHVVCMEPPITDPYHAHSGYSLMENGLKDLSKQGIENFRTYIDPNSSQSQRDAAQNAMKVELRKHSQSENQEIKAEKPTDPSHEPREVWSEDNMNKFFKTAKEAQEAGFDFSVVKDKFTGEVKADWDAEKIRLRNESMAKTVGTELTPGHKAIVFTGSFHDGSSKAEDTSDPAKQPKCILRRHSMKCSRTMVIRRQ